MYLERLPGQESIRLIIDINGNRHKRDFRKLRPLSSVMDSTGKSVATCKYNSISFNVRTPHPVSTESPETAPKYQRYTL